MDSLAGHLITTEQGNAMMAAIERLSKSRPHIVFGSEYTSRDVPAYGLQVQAAEGTKPALRRRPRPVAPRRGR